MSKSHSANNTLIVWKDRKHILGLPISFTRYSMDGERIYTDIGLFNSKIEELLLYRVLDISSSRTFAQKIFGVGTIKLHSADKSNTNLELINIKNSEEVRKMISRTVEGEREKRKMRGREMYGVAHEDMHDSDIGLDNELL